jgi:hypothetical protein
MSYDPACKLEIGRLNGFQKMFSLLVSVDDELQSEILKTLRVFLDLDRTLPATSSASDLTKSGTEY